MYMSMKFKKEKEFVYKGYECMVIGYSIGYRCGYIKLPQGSKFYDKHYDDIPVGVHGGLTFAEIVKEEDQFPAGNWIGFDCAHLGDAKDPSLQDEKYRVIYGNDYDYRGHIWSASEVEEECKKIVDQLLELDPELLTQ